MTDVVHTGRMPMHARERWGHSRRAMGPTYVAPYTTAASGKYPHRGLAPTPLDVRSHEPPSTYVRRNGYKNMIVTIHNASPSM